MIRRIVAERMEYGWIYYMDENRRNTSNRKAVTTEKFGENAG